MKTRGGVQSRARRPFASSCRARWRKPRGVVEGASVERESARGACVYMYLSISHFIYLIYLSIQLCIYVEPSWRGEDGERKKRGWSLQPKHRQASLCSSLSARLSRFDMWIGSSRSLSPSLLPSQDVTCRLDHLVVFSKSNGSVIVANTFDAFASPPPPPPTFLIDACLSLVRALSLSLHPLAPL